MDLTSHMIKQEINRFESVHPCIYTSYDFFDRIKNVELSNKLRDYLISIEEAFVNSQEWTLSRAVVQVKLAFLGSQCSRKSELVHYYLTGAYAHDDSADGGRFKKLVTVGSHPYLLLIRDEPTAPDVQLVNWVDVIVFVVSSTSQKSVRTAYEYYSLVCNLCYPGGRIPPIILIATQDDAAVGQSLPEVENNISYLNSVMNGCPLYQTCAVYGLNVDSVFNSIVVQVLASRRQQQQQPHSLYRMLQPSSAQPDVLHDLAYPMPDASNTLPQHLHLPSAALSASVSVNPRAAPSCSTTEGLSGLDMSTRPQNLQRFSVNLEGRQTTATVYDSQVPVHLAGGPYVTKQAGSPHLIASFDCVDEERMARATKTGNLRSATGQLVRPASSGLAYQLSGLTLSDGRAQLVAPALGSAVDGGTTQAGQTPPGCLSQVQTWTDEVSRGQRNQQPPPPQRMPAPLGSLSSVEVQRHQQMLLPHQQKAANPTGGIWESSGATTTATTGSSRRERPRPQSTGALAAGGRGNNVASGSCDVVGVARCLQPVRQGYLYQKPADVCATGVVGMTKRRKKYVVLTQDARLVWYPTKQDYISGVNGKCIDLALATAFRTPDPASEPHYYSGDEEGPAGSGGGAAGGSSSVHPTLLAPGAGTDREALASPPIRVGVSREEQQGGIQQSVPASTPDGNQTGCGLKEALKRQYKRAKAAVTETAHASDPENLEFLVVTSDGGQWHFEAPSPGLRDDWLQAIESTIASSATAFAASTAHQPTGQLAAIPTTLSTTVSGYIDRPGVSSAVGSSSNQTASSSSGYNQCPGGSPALPAPPVAGACPAGGQLVASQLSVTSPEQQEGQHCVLGKHEVIARVASLPGNQWCADCGAADPDYALLSLAVVVCRECSEVHQSLGTNQQPPLPPPGLACQLSDPRGWRTEHVAVMTAFGNTLANSVWEAAAPSQSGQFQKPDATATREQRTAWINNKYILRVLLPPSPMLTGGSEANQKRLFLTDAVLRRDSRAVLLSLVLLSSPPSGLASVTASPSATASSSVSPLHTAAALGDVAALLLLVWWTADLLYEKDQFGLNAWSYAQAGGQSACARILLAYGCPPVHALAVPVSYQSLHWVPPAPTSTASSSLPRIASTQTDQEPLIALEAEQRAPPSEEAGSETPSSSSHSSASSPSLSTSCSCSGTRTSRDTPSPTLAKT